MYRFFNYATFAPILLILIACFQLFRSHTFQLSAWKGGGYGMFSTIDRPSWRFLRGYITTDSLDIRIADNDLELASDTRLKLRTIPTSSSIQKAQLHVGNQRWIIHKLDSAHQYVAKKAKQDSLTSLGSKHHNVRLEVWRIKFDASTSAMYGEQIR